MFYLRDENREAWLLVYAMLDLERREQKQKGHNRLHQVLER